MNPSTPAAPLRSDGAFEQYDPISNTHENVAAFEPPPPSTLERARAVVGVAGHLLGIVGQHVRAVGGLIKRFLGFLVFCATFPFVADYDEEYTTKGPDGDDRMMISAVLLVVGCFVGGGALAFTYEVTSVPGVVADVLFLVLAAWAVVPTTARILSWCGAGVGTWFADLYRVELSKVKGPRT